jgi:type IV/VI secretion system ImpK/VasF family protein
VQDNLREIFHQQKQASSINPRLEDLYERAKYPLVALVDEVLLTSGWKYASAWESDLLETKIFGTAIAGEKFFKMANELEETDSDLALIFYICLCLGFKGPYSEDDEALQDLKFRLYKMLPEYMASLPSQLTPEAYHVVPKQARKLSPVINLARVAIVCIGFCVIYVIVNQILWHETVDLIHKLARDITSILARF